jgi:pimeloyl-ACP methyl ester carboxylesterase
MSGAGRRWISWDEAATWPMNDWLTCRAPKLHHLAVKKPLILVPGLLCDAAVWAAQAAALADIADVRVANNGEVDSLVRLAEAVIAGAPPRFAVAGHSMGGRIALEIARRVPDRLIGLALLDTGFEALAPGTAGQREVAGRHELLEKARREGMRSMARAWVQGMVYPPRLSDADLIDRILDMFERRTPDLYALQIKALLSRPDATSVLPAIRCPTLVLCGREDEWAPPSRHDLMAKSIPAGRLEVIPECGHMAPMERPEAVSAALRRWLESTDSAAERTC